MGNSGVSKEFVMSKDVQREYWKVERTIKREKKRSCGVCMEPLISGEFVCKFDIDARNSGLK